MTTKMILGEILAVYSKYRQFIHI